MGVANWVLDFRTLGYYRLYGPKLPSEFHIWATHNVNHKSADGLKVITAIEDIKA